VCAEQFLKALRVGEGLLESSRQQHDQDAGGPFADPEKGVRDTSRQVGEGAGLGPKPLFAQTKSTVPERT
jgi:hypothetical protein